MIIDNLTAIPTNSPVVEYLFGFDSMLGNYVIFVILLAILVVLTMAIYKWRDDFVFAFMNADLSVTIMAFFATLIKSTIFFTDGVANRLLGFEKFMFFLFLLVLIVFYQQVSE